MVSTRHHPDEFPEPGDAAGAAATQSSPTGNKTPSSTRSTTTRSRPSTPSSPSASSPSSAVTTFSTTSTTSFGFIHTPNRIITIWLLISLPLVVWDTGYVLLRPHTMPGGRLHSPIWSPYALYGTVDYVYGWPAWNRGDGFTGAQASLNTVETIMYIFYLWILWANGRVGAVRRGARAKSATKPKKSLKWYVLEENRRVENAGLAVLMLWAAAVMTLSKTVLYLLHEAFSSFENVGHNSLPDLILLWIIPNGAWIVLPAYMTWVVGEELWAALDAAGAKKSR